MLIYSKFITQLDFKKSWPFIWLNPRWKGKAIWPFIFHADQIPSRTLIEHEKIHLKQQARGLIIGFYLKYFYYNWKYGYENNPYEIEAYKHQDDWKKE